MSGLVELVRDKLAAEVPALYGRVDGAAELAQLIDVGAVPQDSPAAFVLPLGFRARTGDAAAGMFRQRLDWGVGVVLFVSFADDATGARVLPEVEQLVRAVLAVVCGWVPPGAIGAFEATRGDLHSHNAGTAIFQVDFTVNEQLRIKR